VRDITLEVCDGELFLEDVGSVGTASNGTHGCQVATVATLGLNDKDSRLGSRCRLLYTAADLRTNENQSNKISDYPHPISAAFNTLTASQSFTTMPAFVTLQQQLIAHNTAPSTAALSLAWRLTVLSCGDSGQATSMPASTSTFAYSAVPCHTRDASIEGRIFMSLAHAQYAWTTYIYVRGNQCVKAPQHSQLKGLRTCRSHK